jgi:hypothetical protein
MQAKPFTINQTMRDEVANQLTLQAVAQHGPRIAADLAALNDQFWMHHRVKVEALPGLDKKHWAELIQAGAVGAVASLTPTYQQDRGKDRSPATSEFVAAAHKHNDDAYNALVSRLIESDAFSGVKRLLSRENRYSRSSWSINLVCPSGSIPRLYGMEHITDPALETLGLMICNDIESVINAANAFRSQAMDVLLACRTSRQVEDLFPEAAKLLPKPVKNEKAVAPTELAASVRSMLTKGVPPVTAQA